MTARLPYDKIEANMTYRSQDGRLSGAGTKSKEKCYEDHPELQKAYTALINGFHEFAEAYAQLKTPQFGVKLTLEVKVDLE